jgi:hypothetical protein
MAPLYTYPTKATTGRKTRAIHRSLAAALLTAAGAVSPATANIWSWNAGNGFWMDAGNWLPNSVPAMNPGGHDRVYLGDLPGVQNSTVWLNHAVGSGTLGVNFLEITDGMTLDMNGRELGVFDTDIRLWDAGTRLIVRPSAGINAYDLYTESIFVSSQSELAMMGGQVLTQQVLNNGLLSGWGTFTLVGLDTPIINGGVIAPNHQGLTFVQNLAGRVDLDGLAGAGEVLMTVPFSRLTLQGDTLHDSFSGTITMGTGSLLDMQLSDGWAADSASQINVASSMVGAAAQIDGGHFTFGGDLNIGGSHGHLRVLADATFASSANVFLGTSDRLEFDGDTTIQGGLYTVSAGGRIDFDGPTQIGGGTFNLVGSTPAQGAVNFNAATVWSGATTVNGFARQVGNASVSTPTTIHANVLDMDGNNNATWTINHGLTVNTQAIELGSQQFDGTFNMKAGAIGRLTINLDDPAASWAMNGTMNLAGFGALTTTRVAGSRMIVTGELNMGTGIAQITADTAFQGGDVSVAATGNLRMRANTTVDAPTTFSGAGTLQNWSDGTMTLHSGVSLGQVGLTNNGQLSIGQNGPGIASVDRFGSSATATLAVDIAGYSAGTEHDLLLVTSGAAALNGEINVDLLGLGGGEVFAPGIGDEFTVLSALGGVSGTFTNDPTTQVGDYTYEWAIIYNPNTVVLRLEDIVFTPDCPCAADYNQDGGIDGLDIEAFFIDFENGTGCADVNKDGAIDGQDVEAFFLRFENGGC